MDQEKKQEFQRRLSQCNRGEMIVILYDIYFTYSKDARESYAAADEEGFLNALRHGAACLNQLLAGLDMQYEISSNLYALYQFAKRQLYLSISLEKLDGLNQADSIMEKLGKAFAKAAKEDKSEPIMQNVQQVYAGVTYGKGYLNENCDLENRGFFA